MSFSSPQPAAPVLPTAPSAPPAFGTSDQGQKPKATSSQPTVLGSSLTASADNTATKTLIGGAGIK